MKNSLKMLACLLALLFASGCGGAASSAGTSTQSADASPAAAETSSEETAGPALDGEIKIGLAAMQTGTLSSIGVYQTYGMQMALDEINANGGVQGKKVVMEIADTAADPDMSVNVMNKFVSSDVSIAIGFQLSSMVPAVDSVVREGGLPLIATCTLLRQAGFMLP